MNHHRCLWIFLLVFFVLCGCAQQNPPETTPTVTVDEHDYPDVLECAAAEGFVTAQSIAANTPCPVRLTKYRDHDASPSDGILYDLCIEIDTGTTVLKKVLAAGVSFLQEDSLFFGDVDGDQIQEIFIQENTGGLGGFGLWQTWILKAEGSDIRVLFENFDGFDTGFCSRFLDGCQLDVTNRFTGYRLTFDAAPRYLEYIAGSQELPAGEIELDPFYVFEPTDTDNDGISEVLCKQYTSILFHNDYTGTACSVLKFNGETQAFDVVDAWYEPNTEE